MIFNPLLQVLAGPAFIAVFTISGALLGLAADYWGPSFRRLSGLRVVSSPWDPYDTRQSLRPWLETCLPAVWRAWSLLGSPSSHCAWPEREKIAERFFLQKWRGAFRWTKRKRRRRQNLQETVCKRPVSRKIWSVLPRFYYRLSCWFFF